MSGYTVGQLVDELMGLLNDEDSDVRPDDGVMLNVMGRWTGIRGVIRGRELGIFLDSED